MIFEVSAKNWKQEVLGQIRLVIVDFWHDDCLYCKMLSPFYEELSQEYEGRVKFARFDVRESHENLHLALGYGIMATPTLKFFCQGMPVGELIGFLPKEELKMEIDNIADRAKDCLGKSTRIQLD